MISKRNFQKSKYLTFEYIHEGLTLKLFENCNMHINFQIDPQDVEGL